jgi:hypothetical protein
MISPYTQVILASGEALSAAEVFEGLLHLSRAESAFPLLSERDQTQAAVMVALDALEWGKARDEGETQ